MSSWRIEFKREMRYIWLSKLWLLLAACAVTVCGAAAASNLSNMNSLRAIFFQSLDMSESTGVSLSDALAAPVVETEDSVANVLRYDFENLLSSLQSVTPAGMATTSVELLAFIGAPIIFGIFGIVLATVDYSTGVIGVRATQTSMTNCVLAKLAAVSVFVLATVAMVAFGGWLTGFLIESQGRAVSSELGFGMAPTLEGGSIFRTIGVSLVLSIFVGLVATSFGLLFRRRAVPLVVWVLAAMVLPFLGAFDPRNIMVAIGYRTMDFVGGFQPRPPYSVGLPAGIVACILALFALATIGYVVFSRRSKYPMVA